MRIANLAATASKVVNLPKIPEFLYLSNQLGSDGEILVEGEESGILLKVVGEVQAEPLYMSTIGGVRVIRLANGEVNEEVTITITAGTGQALDAWIDSLSKGNAVMKYSKKTIKDGEEAEFTDFYELGLPDESDVNTVTIQIFQNDGLTRTLTGETLNYRYATKATQLNSEARIQNAYGNASINKVTINNDSGADMIVTKAFYSVK